MQALSRCVPSLAWLPCTKHVWGVTGIKINTQILGYNAYMDSNLNVM